MTAHHRPRHAAFVTLAVVLAVAASACGGPQVPAATDAAATAVPAAFVGDPLQVAVPTAPIAPSVQLKTPELEVIPPQEGGADEAALALALATDGVDALTVIRSFTGELVTPESDATVTIGAVDPVTFRPFTPESTAQAPEVWERLQAGDALVRHDVAQRLGLELGGLILLVTPAGQQNIRIGAFASNGSPPVADIIVSSAMTTTIGHDEDTHFLVALEQGATSANVGEALVRALGGGKASRREAPQAMQARLGQANAAGPLTSFSYRDHGDGMITIEGSWVRDWIVAVDLPRVGRAHVNRIMVGQLFAAFQELEQLGLLDLLDPEQFGGGWVPRHIDWDPRRPLSMHAWGLAIDINTRENPLGARPTLDPRIVATFERWGFAWGGRWERPDGMHFELAQVIDTA